VPAKAPSQGASTSTSTSSSSSAAATTTTVAAEATTATPAPNATPTPTLAADASIAASSGNEADLTHAAVAASTTTTTTTTRIVQKAMFSLFTLMLERQMEGGLIYAGFKNTEIFYDYKGIWGGGKSSGGGKETTAADARAAPPPLSIQENDARLTRNTSNVPYLVTDVIRALLVKPPPSNLVDGVGEVVLKPLRPRAAALAKAAKEGHRGGRKLLSSLQAVIKIQSLWRARKVRKAMKKRMRAATIIAAVFRGKTLHRKYKASIVRIRELQAQEEIHTKRLKSIRAKERELTLLRRVPKDEFNNYDRIRKEHSARVLQGFWRQKSWGGKRAKKSTAQLADETAAKFSRGAGAGAGAGAEKSDATTSIQNQKEAQKTKLVEQVTRAVASAALFKAPSSSSSSPSHSIHGEGRPFKIEVDALGLAQLQARIRDEASKKSKKLALEKNSGGIGKENKFDPAATLSLNKPPAGKDGGGGGGVRRKYQELAEAQSKASVLVDEHLNSNELRKRRQAERLASLGQAVQLTKQLSEPLSLQEARDMIKQGRFAPPPSTPVHGAAHVVKTELSMAARAGDTKLEVPHTTGFAKNALVSIGTGAHKELHTIVAFGSIILATPLLYEHAAGTPIVQMDKDEAGAVGVAQWLAGLPSDGLATATEAHLRTINAMKDKGHWGLVAAPHDVTGMYIRTHTDTHTHTHIDAHTHTHTKKHRSTH